jgi:hypothetical protein
VFNFGLEKNTCLSIAIYDLPKRAFACFTQTSLTLPDLYWSFDMVCAIATASIALFRGLLCSLADIGAE